VKLISLDTDAINSLLDPGLLQEVIAAAKRRGVIFVLVHVVKDQLAQTGDADRRARLLEVYEALPKLRVKCWDLQVEPPTFGFVLDISRLDSAEVQDSATLAAVTTTGRGKLHDALIAATAMAKADVLVTDDTRLTKRVKAHTAPCEVWTFEQLVRFLRDV
jgi:predicted nucleic acid-binding protein